MAGLDGIRGLAALFVVLHHSWLMSFPGFPAPVGPWWAAWLAYGHFAVVIFIVLSGFSLAVSPARNEWRINSLRRFAFRRAWRILPPYWPALLYSCIVAWTLVPQPGEGAPTLKSIVVHGLLLQDVFGSPSPNGAFWSIAVEAQLYLVFPLMLLIIRRWGASVMLSAVTLTVVLVGALAPIVRPVGELMRFTPQFAALFALGAVAAGIVVAADRWRALPWHWFSLAAAVPVALFIAIIGPEWTVKHFFWVDLSLGPAFGFLLAAVATGRPRSFVWLLDTRPVRSLGSFSYSLYLIHAPIVVSVHTLLIAPNTEPGVGQFLITLAVCVPLSVVAARLFAGVFELPFTRNRSVEALKQALLRRNNQPEQLAAAVPDSPAVTP
ncbi:acyltransferase [Lentzea sp. NBRC 105346]|uniref:acyltransferase family protein n=1 Tax=Lentzea sp. NBRC 105346 TaxID=3032205 RepID=UPI0024A22CF1|nr:acyltransferase [Lentzea sp. NBRC 105346]GLZ28897.1 acyltransferase [Lentzea sp. NBRC 105346]